MDITYGGFTITMTSQIRNDGKETMWTVIASNGNTPCFATLHQNSDIALDKMYTKINNFLGLTKAPKPQKKDRNF